VSPSSLYQHQGERRRVLREGPEGVTFDRPDAPDEPAETVSRGAWLEWTRPPLLLDFEGKPIRGQRAKPTSSMSQALLFDEVAPPG
jgi:hypothetical protein